METSASFEARSAPSSYPTAIQSLSPAIRRSNHRIARPSGVICKHLVAEQGIFGPIK